MSSHLSVCFVLSISKRLKGKGEKGDKGLRHFSMKVCEEVQRKGVTSYNEVADELVAEFSDPRNMSPSDQALVRAFCWPVLLLAGTCEWLFSMLILSAIVKIGVL